MARCRFCSFSCICHQAITATPTQEWTMLLREERGMRFARHSYAVNSRCPRVTIRPPVPRVFGNAPPIGTNRRARAGPRNFLRLFRGKPAWRCYRRHRWRSSRVGPLHSARWCFQRRARRGTTTKRLRSAHYTCICINEQTECRVVALVYLRCEGGRSWLNTRAKWYDFAVRAVHERRGAVDYCRKPS